MDNWLVDIAERKKSAGSPARAVNYRTYRTIIGGETVKTDHYFIRA